MECPDRCGGVGGLVGCMDRCGGVGEAGGRSSRQGFELHSPQSESVMFQSAISAAEQREGSWDMG